MIIKEYIKGNKKLIQSEIIDHMGLKKNFIEIQFINEHGQKVNYPVMGLPRLNNMSKSDEYTGENTEPYTDDECEELLNKHNNLI